MVAGDGTIKTERQEIANAFADFYENLYSWSQPTTETELELPDYIDIISAGEVAEQIKKLRRNKCADEICIVAEILAAGGEVLAQELATTFDDVIKRRAGVPDRWRMTKIIVLYKKGEARLPENYRPICIIPALYKLFSKVLYARIKKALEAAQTRDQAGFRNAFSCDDHLFTAASLVEKCNEVGKPCWMATLDFKKAFDTIIHSSIWNALEKQSIPATYIAVLRLLYSNQKARVQTDASSRTFAICRGTKQGDPISSALFNAVLEEIMKPVKQKWSRKGWGVQVGWMTDEKLTNLRFADDVLLIARTLPQLKMMLQDIIDAANAVGLQLHPDKTKILHNSIGYGVGATSAKLRSMEIEILRGCQNAMYLGRMLKPTDMQNEELKNRLSRAWAKFNFHKSDLVNDQLPIGLRLKLFDATVTPTLLFGSGTWSLTQRMRDMLKTQQRKMLRLIAKCHRIFPKDPHTTDEYVAWIKSATDKVNQLEEEFGVRNWVKEQNKRKWRWAHKVAICDDRRWSYVIAHWTPPDIKVRGRPKARWPDELNTYLTKITGDIHSGSDWIKRATDKEYWQKLEEGFLEHCSCRSPPTEGSC